MAIRLRVAGIYYDEKFPFETVKAAVGSFVIPGRTAPSTTEPTIFELLEVATNTTFPNREDFNYVFERRGTKLSLTSIGVTLTEDLVGSLGGKYRPAGTYQLTEIAIPSGVVAWQYYVYRKGVSYSQLGFPTNPATVPTTGFSPATGLTGATFTGFDQFILEPDDEVIWRQVAILRGPNVPNG
jgi:hypothetical protein